MRSEGYNVSVEDVTGRSRVHYIAFARQLNQLLLWGHYGYGVTEIGRLVGVNHATVIYSCSSAVRSIEWHGWCGRVYVEALKELGLSKLDYIHPRLTDRPKTTREEREQHALARARGFDSVSDALEDEDDEDQYIKPMNWTPEEMAELSKLNAYPGGEPANLSHRDKHGNRYPKRKT